MSRKQINELLWNKLPVDYSDTQRINKIGNLIMELKRQGVIKTDEKRLWHLAWKWDYVGLREKLREITWILRDFYVGINVRIFGNLFIYGIFADKI